MCDDDSLAWTTLARTPGLEVSAIAAAIDRLGSPQALVNASAADLRELGLATPSREFLASRAAIPDAATQHWLSGQRHHLLPFPDPRFPRLLRELPQCPVALYVLGNPAVLNDPQLAVVGTRSPTAQGRDTAFDFAEHLAVRGLGITSGLAEGIDTSAHRGALRGQGITLGVLGTGIDRVYPESNAGLHDEISMLGALISEFPVGTPPRRGNFPRRNRLIAGLSLGTLVVEAARRSGSLITARLARALGRSVFAVPGSIHNPMSRGCHELIKAGARLVETADDIVAGLNFSAFFSDEFRRQTALAAPLGRSPGMDKEHKILLDALGFDPVDLDRLVVRTGFKAEVVSSMVLILELEGHVQAAPGAATPESPTGEPEVKDNVLDLLIYLFENYMSADDEPRPDRNTLKLELDKAGFAEGDIERALEWLDGLSGEQLGKVAEATARAVRIFSGQELLRLDTDVRGYLMYLENVRILSATQRELVIDRLMALEADEIDIEQVKWVVLMVLFSQPGQESAYAQMEDLVFEERSDALH